MPTDFLCQVVTILKIDKKNVIDFDVKFTLNDIH